MKRNILLVLFLAGRFVFSQTPYAIWEDQQNNNYKYVRLNPATGVKTNIATLPPMIGFVATDASAYNYNLNYYHFVAQTNTNKILYTLNGMNGSVVYSPVMTNTVVGIEYNCADSTLYGIEVNGNTYNYVKIDPLTAAVTLIAPMNGMQGYVGGAFSIDLQQQAYIFKALTSTTFRLRAINVKTGAVLYDNPFTDNVVGHRYSPTDNAVYGMWDNGGVYQLEKIDYTTGSHSTVASYTAMSTGFLGQMFSMSQNGDYTLRAFDSGNAMSLFTLDCTTGSVINFSNTSDNAVGFEEPTCATASTSVSSNETWQLTLFPNPASDKLNIVTGSNAVFSLDLFNTLGMRLLHLDELKSGATVTLPGNASGTYFVAITCNGKRVVRPLILAGVK